MGFKEKEILLNSFVYSNFNYYPLVWHFRSAKSVKKIVLHEAQLQFMFFFHLKVWECQFYIINTTSDLTRF